MRTRILLVSIMLALAGCGGGGAANNTSNAAPAEAWPEMAAPVDMNAAAFDMNAVAADAPAANAPAPQNAPPVENMAAPVPEMRASLRPLPRIPLNARGEPVPRSFPIEAGPPVDANHAQAAPAPIPANQMAAASRPAADGTVFCELIQDRVPATECDYYRELLGRLQQGNSALQAPRQMTRGRATRVSFAIARPASPGQVGAVTNSANMLSGPSEDTGPLRVGRRMAVQLSGDGFAVTPEGPVERDLSLSGGARWDWQVTPREPGRRQLQLTAYVVVRAPTQQSGTPNFLLTFSREVEVRVDRSERVRDFIERWTGWFTLTNGGLVALIALIGGIGGLLVALKKPRAWLKRQWRRLRGKPAEPPPAAPPKPRKPRR